MVTVNTLHRPHRHILQVRPRLTSLPASTCRLDLDELKKFTDESKRELGDSCVGIDGPDGVIETGTAGLQAAASTGAPGTMEISQGAGRAGNTTEAVNNGKNWSPGPPGSCPYFT